MTKSTKKCLSRFRPDRHFEIKKEFIIMNCLLFETVFRNCRRLMIKFCYKEMFFFPFYFSYNIKICSSGQKNEIILAGY